MRGVGGQREVHKRSLFEFATYVEFANLPFENGGILSLTSLLAKRPICHQIVPLIKEFNESTLLDNLAITGTPRPRF